MCGRLPLSQGSCHSGSLPSFDQKPPLTPCNDLTLEAISPVHQMLDVLERLKVLIDSSTPIIVMETVEEMRAVRLVRAASSPLNLAVFEWSIASGLVRCGS